MEPELKFYDISEDEMDAMDKLRKNMPSARAAFETLVRAILSAGLSIEKTGYVMSESDRKRFNSTWLLFCKEWMDIAFGYGIVATNTPRGAIDPVVLQRSCVKLSVAFVPNGTRVYRACPREPFMGSQTTTPLHQVKVYEVYPPELDIAGCVRLQPPISSISQLNSLWNSIVNHTNIANARLAKPAVFTASIERNTNRAASSSDYNIPGESRLAAIDERQARTSDSFRLSAENDARMRMYNMQMMPNPNDHMYDIDPVNKTGRYPQTIDALAFTNYWEHLPQDRVLQQGPRSQAPNHLIDILSELQDAVGQATGVPAQLWGTKRQANAVNQQVMATFFATASEWRSRLRYVISVEYESINGESERKHVLDTYDKKKGLTPKEHVRDHMITITFPSMADPLSLIQQYEMKAIDEESYIKKMATYYGESEDDYDLARMKEYHDLKMQVLRNQATAPQKTATATATTATKQTKLTTFHSLAPKPVANHVGKTGGGKSVNPNSLKSHSKRDPPTNKA